MAEPAWEDDDHSYDFAIQTGPLAFRSVRPAVALLLGAVPVATALLGAVRWLPLGEGVAESTGRWRAFSAKLGPCSYIASVIGDCHGAFEHTLRAVNASD